jgi:hypothetical protein
MSEGARNGEPVGLHGLEKSDDAVREETAMMTLPVDVSMGSGPPHAGPAPSSGPHLSAP